MEELNSNQPANEAAKEWENMAKEAKKTLRIGQELPGGFRVASCPFDDKNSAYEEIKDLWNGVEGVTTYFKDDYWYIVTSK